MKLGSSKMFGGRAGESCRKKIKMACVIEFFTGIAAAMQIRKDVEIAINISLYL